MQLKNQKSEPSSTQSIQLDIPASPPKKKHSKLGILIRLSIFFTVGLGGPILFALPSLLNCGNKALEVGAKIQIRNIESAQQAYFLKNNKFAESISELNIGEPNYSNSYDYFMQVDRQLVVTYAQGNKPNYKSYLGVVFVGAVLNSDRPPTTQSIMCEVDQPQPFAKIIPTYQNGTVSCPPGTKLITTLTGN